MRRKKSAKILNGNRASEAFLQYPDPYHTQRLATIGTRTVRVSHYLTLCVSIVYRKIRNQGTHSACPRQNGSHGTLRPIDQQGHGACLPIATHIPLSSLAHTCTLHAHWQPTANNLHTAKKGSLLQFWIPDNNNHLIKFQSHFWLFTCLQSLQR